MGDVLLQKTYTVDFLTKKKKKNNGEKEQYYATGSHDPIIDRETFETVQKLLKEKAEYFGSPRPSKSYPLSKRIRCKECGAYFIRRSNKDKVIWSCYNHERDKNNCHAKRYREEDIYKAYMRMFNKLYCYRQTLLRQTLAHIDYVTEQSDRQSIQPKCLRPAQQKGNVRKPPSERLYVRRNVLYTVQGNRSIAARYKGRPRYSLRFGT